MTALRRSLFLFLSIACTLGLHARAESVSQLPKPTSYVEDFAGVVDPGSKQQMEQLSREVYEQAHATIEVVTIHSLDGEPIEQFATDLEDKWKVGPKSSDRGILMILAINDRKRRIEVGYGLEGILPDAKVGDIGRTMVPYLQRGDYGGGLLEAEQQIAGVIAADAHVTLTGIQNPAPHAAPQQRSGNNWIGLVIFFIIFLFIVGGGRRGGGGWLPWFILGNMMGGRRDGGWGGGGGFGGGDGGGGGDFGGGFGGGSGGGGASGGW